MRLYLSYGSNMNVAQMTHRCPGAKIYAAGVLFGYKLDFRRGGFATIEKGSPADKVPVLIWDINEQNEAALDRYEGYPGFYYKDTVTAETDQGPIRAMVYIMTEQYNQQQPPTDWYLRTIIQGYKDSGHDKHIKSLNKLAMDIYDKIGDEDHERREKMLQGRRR